MSEERGKAGAKLGLVELVAIGIGGMIGGGIFSVLGLAVDITGNAAPLAFAIGAIIAAFAGHSYIRLALAFRSDGASYTYLEYAFPAHPNIGGFTGWVVVLGYIGTLALYAFTFAAYSADMLGNPGLAPLRFFLTGFILLFFMIVNLLGTRASGHTEDVIVYAKVAILALVAVIGLWTIDVDRLLPVASKGVPSIFAAGAVIFVAYEGFQLITNAVTESEMPARNIPRGIYTAVAVVAVVYILLAIVGVGNLTPQEIRTAEEYALAVAVEPVLGDAGRFVIGVAAVLATASAINATIFGASHMMAVMATEKMMPRPFSHRSRRDTPAVAIVVLTALALLFAATGGLEMIAAFSSMTFLLVSLAVSVANWKLRAKTGAKGWVVISGILFMLAALGELAVYMWETERERLFIALGLYLAVLVAELAFSKRRLIFRPHTGDAPRR